MELEDYLLRYRDLETEREKLLTALSSKRKLPETARRKMVSRLCSIRKEINTLNMRVSLWEHSRKHSESRKKPLFETIKSFIFGDSEGEKG